MRDFDRTNLGMDVGETPTLLEFDWTSRWIPPFAFGERPSRIRHRFERWRFRLGISKKTTFSPSGENVVFSEN